MLAGFDELHFAHTHACVAYQRATGLDHQLPLAETAFIQAGQQFGPQRIGGRRGVAVVVDAQAAAEIQVVNRYASSFDQLDQIQHFVQRIHVRAGGGDLRADMAINAHDFQPGQRGGMLVSLQSTFVRDAKFVALEAGGNIGVGFRVDVGIDANTDRCHLAQRQSHLVQHIQFCFALHIETSDTGLQSGLHFSAGFADSRKNHIRCVRACGLHPGQFTRRHDVKTATGLGKHLQHRQTGIGLHGVMHFGLATGKRAMVCRQRMQHGRFGIDKQRRAVGIGQIAQAQLFHI